MKWKGGKEEGEKGGGVEEWGGREEIKLVLKVNC